MDWKAWLVAALTLVFTALQYADPERKVLSAIHLPAFTGNDVFGLLGSVGIIVLLVMGFRRLAILKTDVAETNRSHWHGHGRP